MSIEKNKINKVFIFIYCFILGHEYNDILLKLNAGLLISVLLIVYNFKYIIYDLFKNNSLLIKSLLLFVTCHTLTNTQNGDLINSIQDLINISLLINIFIFLIFIKLFKDIKYFNIAIYGFIISMISVSTLSYFDYGVSSELNTELFFRKTYYGENPNNLASKCVLALIMIFIILKGLKRNFLIKISLIISCLFLLNSVFLTASRSALIILMIPSSFFFLKNFKLINIIISLGIVFFAYSAIELFFIDNYTYTYERLLKTLVERDYGLRDTLVNQAFINFSVNPFFGYGWKSLKSYGFTRDSHNVFISVIQAGGITTFIPFLFFFVSLFRRVLINNNIVCTIIFIYISMDMSQSGGIITHDRLWFTFAIIYSLKSRILYENSLHI